MILMSEEYNKLKEFSLFLLNELNTLSRLYVGLYNQVSKQKLNIKDWEEVCNKYLFEINNIDKPKIKSKIEDLCVPVNFTIK